MGLFSGSCGVIRWPQGQVPGGAGTAGAGAFQAGNQGASQGRRVAGGRLRSIESRAITMSGENHWMTDAIKVVRDGLIESFEEGLIDNEDSVQVRFLFEKNEIHPQIEFSVDVSLEKDKMKFLN
jgi:hypothetical protein